MYILKVGVHHIEVAKPHHIAPQQISRREQGEQPRHYDPLRHLPLMMLDYHRQQYSHVADEFAFNPEKHYARQLEKAFHSNFNRPQQRQKDHRELLCTDCERTLGIFNSHHLSSAKREDVSL